MEVADASCAAPRRPGERPDFFTFVIMENGRQIRTQLAEKRLKLDSSSLEYEIAPTGPRPAQCVSRCSHAHQHPKNHKVGDFRASWHSSQRGQAGWLWLVVVLWRVQAMVACLHA